jgi:GH25 family lysozyme M1 (1,4-beta-N-acetylmuramidase)
MRKIQEKEMKNIANTGCYRFNKPYISICVYMYQETGWYNCYIGQALVIMI